MRPVSPRSMFASLVVFLLAAGCGRGLSATVCDQADHQPGWELETVSVNDDNCPDIDRVYSFDGSSCAPGCTCSGGTLWDANHDPSQPPVCWFELHMSCADGSRFDCSADQASSDATAAGGCDWQLAAPTAIGTTDCAYRVLWFVPSPSDNTIEF